MGSAGGGGSSPGSRSISRAEEKVGCGVGFFLRRGTDSDMIDLHS